MSSKTIMQLLGKGLEVYYSMFNHILRDFFALASSLALNARIFSLACTYLQTSTPLATSLINLHSPPVHSMLSVSDYHCRLAKKQKTLYERMLFWSVKTRRGSGKSVATAFEYFVRREVMRRMKEEEKDPDEQVFFVPFHIKE